MAIDEGKLNELLGRVVGDLGSAMSGALVVVGDKLGLYKALAAGGAQTAAELAGRAEISERYAREWLNSQAASGFVVYDAGKQTYSMTEEQIAAFADENSPASVVGGFLLVQAAWNAVPRMVDNFKTGGGLAWGDQHPCLFEGTARFFRAGYLGNLVGSWIPALEGVKAKLEKGAKVADVGCGLGASTIIMAQAFPKSTFVGFDSHVGSVETARERAAAAGVGDRVKFEVAKSTDFPGDGYDLIANFDCLHDMEDPAGAARHARKAIAKDGTWMIVEPFAHDLPEANHNPIGRVFYSASTMICVPHSLSQNGPALGAQAGESRLRQIAVEQGGFGKLRRATETPFNLVLEAKP